MIYLKHTLLKQARALETPLVGPSIPRMKSILEPIQLKCAKNDEFIAIFSTLSCNEKIKVIRWIHLGITLNSIASQSWVWPLSELFTYRSEVGHNYTHICKKKAKLLSDSQSEQHFIIINIKSQSWFSKSMTTFSILNGAIRVIR